MNKTRASVGSHNPQQLWEPFQASPKNPWSNRLAAHLLRRAGFGGTIDEIKNAQRAGLEKTLDRLFDTQSAAAFDQEMQTSGRLLTTGADSKKLAAWWLLRMAKSPCPLQEKMTLFWHGHFATGADKVKNARAMLRQNELIRTHCLAKFQPLVADLSRDVAMLIYLDSTENRKTRPNENYARELMELFCLGPGNYTETDIKEIARCFTGWEVRHKKFRFNSYQHDRGTKTFLNTSGEFDGDDAINAILQQNAAAVFLARKLIRFFVFDDQPISAELAQPLANVLRETDFNIRAALRRLLGSTLFFSDLAVSNKIKSPVELAIGTLRFFGASVNMQRLGDRLQRLGQLPLYPPNVKGWDGGRAWINASTVLARANLIEEVFRNGDTEYQTGNLPQWVAKNRAQLKPDWMQDYLLALELPQNVRTVLEDKFQREPAVGIACLSALPEFQLN